MKRTHWSLEPVLVKPKLLAEFQSYTHSLRNKPQVRDTDLNFLFLCRIIEEIQLLVTPEEIQL